MTQTLYDEQRSELRSLIAKMTGLHFPETRDRDLERNLAKTAADLGFSDLGSFASRMLNAPLSQSEIDVLVGHLTVGETYFFRDPKLFRALERHILPELISAKRVRERSLRIWSAGCCTGEEAYSVAILLCRLLPDIQDWNIKILATDINRHFLKKAIEGRYGPWSFRDGPIDATFFRPVSHSQYEVQRLPKSLVSFSYFNLMEDAYPALLNGASGLDLIFCRNVLMYFTPEFTRMVVRKLCASLADEAWLIVSPFEMPHVLSQGLSTVYIEDTFAYRKNAQSATALFSPPLYKFIEPSEVKNADSEYAFNASLPGGEVLENVGSGGAVLEGDFFESDLEKTVVSKEKTNEASVEEQAYALYRLGDCDAAYTLLSELPSESQSATPEVFRLLGRICANRGKLDEALGWCEKAIESDRFSPVSYYLQAVISLERGKLELAQVALRQTLYLDPQFIVAHFALSDLARTQGSLQNAERHRRHALELLSALDPESEVPESEGMTAGQLRRILEMTPMGADLQP